MHPINKVLSLFGLQLSRTRESMIPKDFMENYNRNFTELKKNLREFNVFRELYYEVIGVHPENHIDYECGFAAYHINKLNPKSILDIGSYRHFIIGMLSHFKVTTLDIRDRKPISNNEVVITGDARNLNLPDNSFDVVISLCTLEHFGLGRYGDEFDLDADKKAFSEMIRVLKPNGRLIFTTTISRSQPSIAFNAHRIYNYEMLRTLCAKLTYEEEKFYSHRLGGFCALEEVTTEPKQWDVYCGCWKK